MNYVLLLFGLLLFVPRFVGAQAGSTIKGIMLDGRSKNEMANGKVAIEGTSIEVNTNLDGTFVLSTLLLGDHIITISAPDCIPKRIPVHLENIVLNLGNIFLENDGIMEKADNLVTLTDSELFDEEVNSNTLGLLQATRDVFLNRAAFDFGQAFFRIRGYDSQNGSVLINGIPMNRFFDGRPLWNNWGGLNDVIRNQQFTMGLEASDFVFGGILGNVNIDTRPSGLRSGTRVSVSASNRTYAGRLMATYSSGLSEKGLAYTLSGSRRWAKQGYIGGTLYDAFSFFGALEYRFNEQNSITLTGIFASNRRGRSSAITEEVFELIGEKYNPYWGEQGDKIRNSRERSLSEPILMLNHYYEADKISVTTGIAYQFGTQEKSRLAYYNAPNPDPTYYRYLPSFYINSPIGANFISADLAKQAFLQNPQIDWGKLYEANSGGKAVYLLSDDVTDGSQYTFNAIVNISASNNLLIDFGAMFKKSTSKNHAKITDLLGADYHDDIDPFSKTLNDVHGNVQKNRGQVFNYNYNMSAGHWNAFAQLRYNHNKWIAFLSGSLSGTKYQREGLYQNERFFDSSFGKGEKIEFADYGIKGGLTHRLTGRHWVTAQGALMTRPPVIRNVFINPRENNLIIANVSSETISTFDLNYFIRLPELTGRLTGFYTRFQNTTDINFFFVDAGVGSDFVQEVLTDLDKLHLGVELGLEYQLSSAVKLSGVAAIGKFVYASDPSVSINFDTAGAAEGLIDPEGSINLGVAKIKDYKLAQGPQKALAFGVEYRDPNYWWLGATANYLANNYANISTITRTGSFILDPDSGVPFIDATQEKVNDLLQQKPLGTFYLLNLVGGKSWLKNGKYLSIFVSINNVFDAVFRTGGYEQSRNGNYGQLQRDNASGTPSFAPKYWYGFGRTYFLNLAFSF